MPSATLTIPGSARAHGTPSALSTSGGDSYSDILAERIRTYGTDEGSQVYEWAERTITIAAGAPGTTTTDLSTLISQNGTTLSGVAGKCVYLELLIVAGAEACVRKSAATPLEVASGVTDTIPLYGSTKLIDRLPNTAVRTVPAPAFDATHKSLTIESTAGATIKILVAVV